jgi:hypothetical protein
MAVTRIRSSDLKKPFGSVPISHFFVHLLSAFRDFIVDALDLKNQVNLIGILLIPIEQRLSPGSQSFDFFPLKFGYG